MGCSVVNFQHISCMLLTFFLFINALEDIMSIFKIK